MQRKPHDDDRKTAVYVAHAPHRPRGARSITTFADARTIMRSRDVRQGGFEVEMIEKRGVKNPSVIYLDGERHRKQRGATARFFAPKTVTTQYRETMTRESEQIIEEFRESGDMDLGRATMELAVAVASAIVGLTESDSKAMARRLTAFFKAEDIAKPAGPIGRLFERVRMRISISKFHLFDVKPAIAARRRQPREDLLSHLLAEDYSEAEILIECVSYASAGMVTTREFIAMAAWHLIEQQALKERFLGSDEAAQIEILEEILRVDPIIGRLYRRLDSAINLPDSGATLPAGCMVEFDIRAINADENVAGGCPHKIDIDRQMANKTNRAVFSFGDGPHRCPGAQVALQETAIFLDLLLRVPGLRLDREPSMGWVPLISSYELSGARLRCDPN